MKPPLEDPAQPSPVASHPDKAGVREALEQALALHQRGDLAKAQALYQQVLILHPHHPDALHLLGVIAYQTRDYARAVELISQAIEISGDLADAHLNLGNALQELKQWESALVSYERAIALRPDYAEAFYNCGNAQYSLGQLDAAVADYDRAIALRPGYAEAHNNRGNVLRDLKQFDAALASFDRAIALNPASASAYRNRGVLLQDLRWYEAALSSYLKAIALAPQDIKANNNLALCRLSMGDFARGWEGYEWRLKSEQPHRTTRIYTQPLWQGKESLVEKTILLHCEQGLGDTLQFCRYAKLVSDLGARVILQVQAPLLPLLKSLAGVTQLVAEGGALPAFDYHCPLPSLPLAFKTDIHTIPASARYLASDPHKVAQWRARLGEQKRPRIGLTWSGNPNFYGDDKRSIALSEFVKLMPDRDFEYICLQKEVRDRDKETLRSRSDILFVGNELTDFSDTAALCECVDLVVSTCTSVPHLSCALGRPTWLLLSSSADWRWLLDRTDSPWYPSAMLYRQQNIGDWDGVFTRVAADLAQRFFPSRSSI